MRCWSLPEEKESIPRPKEARVVLLVALSLLLIANLAVILAFDVLPESATAFLVRSHLERIHAEAF